MHGKIGESSHFFMQNFLKLHDIYIKKKDVEDKVIW